MLLGVHTLGGQGKVTGILGGHRKGLPERGTNRGKSGKPGLLSLTVLPTQGKSTVFPASAGFVASAGPVGTYCSGYIACHVWTVSRGNGSCFSILGEPAII